MSQHTPLHQPTTRSSAHSSADSSVDSSSLPHSAYQAASTVAVHPVLQVFAYIQRQLAHIALPAFFTALMCLVTMHGAIAIPGTPIPVTLQTLVVILAGLTMNWRQAGASMVAYLTLGAIGLPVFAGGASTMALVSPAAGFLYGFVPAAMVIAKLKGTVRNGAGQFKPLYALIGRYLAASVIGGIAVVYVFGFIVQSTITGVDLITVAQVNMPFIAVDICKAIAASLTVAGVTRLARN